jgi:hypothetical protein
MYQVHYLLTDKRVQVAAALVAAVAALLLGMDPAEALGRHHAF